LRVGDELATGGGASGPKRFGPDSLRSSCGASGGGFTSLLFFFVFFRAGAGEGEYGDLPSRC